MDLPGSRSSKISPFGFINRIKINPGMVFALIIITALLAFEMFNYSTTDYALHDLLGNLRFAGMMWSTILAIAFCGIDFAGIARLFTPQQGIEEPKEVWYLFGAWLLAATMNAVLTWWGVSMAIVTHRVESTAVMDAQTLTKIVPVFVALMVWIIRILIIGSLSVAGDRLIWGSKRRPVSNGGQRSTAPGMAPAINRSISQPLSAASSSRPVPRPIQASAARQEQPAYTNRPEPIQVHPEPTYHSLSMAAPRPAPRPSSSISQDSGTRRM